MAQHRCGLLGVHHNVTCVFTVRDRRRYHLFTEILFNAVYRFKPPDTYPKCAHLSFFRDLIQNFHPHGARGGTPEGPGSVKLFKLEMSSLSHHRTKCLSRYSCPFNNAADSSFSLSVKSNSSAASGSIGTRLMVCFGRVSDSLEIRRPSSSIHENWELSR